MPVDTGERFATDRTGKAMSPFKLGTDRSLHDRVTIAVLQGLVSRATPSSHLTPESAKHVVAHARNIADEFMGQRNENL